MLDIVELLIRIWKHHRSPEPIGPEPGDRSKFAFDLPSVERAPPARCFDFHNACRQ